MMIIEDTNLKGVKLIKPTVHEDYRGTNIETWHKDNYAHLGVNFILDSISTSRRHVLRGIHGDDIAICKCGLRNLYAFFSKTKECIEQIIYNRNFKFLETWIICTVCRAVIVFVYIWICCWIIQYVAWISCQQ